MKTDTERGIVILRAERQIQDTYDARVAEISTRAAAELAAADLERTRGLAELCPDAARLLADVLQLNEAPLPAPRRRNKKTATPPLDGAPPVA
jgi:hypothetical protein